MKKILSFLGGIALVLAVGGLINFLDGLDGKPESPTPSPTVRHPYSGDYDPDVERHDQNEDACANWYYC